MEMWPWDSHLFISLSLNAKQCPDWEVHEKCRGAKFRHRLHNTVRSFVAAMAISPVDHTSPPIVHCSSMTPQSCGLSGPETTPDKPQKAHVDTVERLSLSLEMNPNCEQRPSACAQNHCCGVALMTLCRAARAHFGASQSLGWKVVKKLRGGLLGAQMAPKSGFWTQKEVFRGDATGSRDSAESSGDQREPTESIVGWVGREEEKLDQVGIPVANLVIRDASGCAWLLLCSGPHCT